MYQRLPCSASGNSISSLTWFCGPAWAYDKMWPHSGNARKYSWKHLKSEFIWEATIIIWELYLSFLAGTDIMRCLWNYRTDFHCSSCWQMLLSWGCRRTTDQSHMEYAEMLLCRNRRRFNSSCRIKSPDINMMLIEANRMQMLSSWGSNVITDTRIMLTCSNTHDTNMFGGGCVVDAGGAALVPDIQQN